jgi:hypothetical protein
VHELVYEKSTEEAHMARNEAMLDRIDRLLAVWNGNRPEDSAAPPTLYALLRQVDPGYRPLAGRLDTRLNS